MKNISKTALITTLVVGATMIGSSSVSASEGNMRMGEGMHAGMREEGGMGGQDKFHLVSQEMKEGLREEHREEFENLSKEEQLAQREEHREERKANREENQQEVADFVGVSSDELKQAHENGTSIGDLLTQNGKTQEDATTFLTEQATDRADSIVERHELDTEEEATVRGRITEFVTSILGRWFQ